MMRPLLLALLLALAACKRDRAAQAPPTTRDSTTVDSTMALVARAAGVTLGTREFPARSDSVLAASGLTIEEYEALLYRIAADPEVAILYQTAIGGKN